MYRLNCEVYKLVVWSFFSVLFSFSGLIYSSSFYFIYMFCKHSSPEKSYIKVQGISEKVLCTLLNLNITVAKFEMNGMARELLTLDFTRDISCNFISSSKLCLGNLFERCLVNSPQHTTTTSINSIFTICFRIFYSTFFTSPFPLQNCLFTNFLKTEPTVSTFFYKEHQTRLIISNTFPTNLSS